EGGRRTRAAGVGLEEIIAILYAVDTSRSASILPQTAGVCRYVIHLPVRELRSDVVANDDEDARVGWCGPPGELRAVVSARRPTGGAGVLDSGIRNGVDQAEWQPAAIHEGCAAQRHALMVLVAVAGNGGANRGNRSDGGQDATEQASPVCRFSTGSHER